MSVDSNALSLIELAQYSNSPLVKEVAMSMIKAGSVFQDVPAVTRPTFNLPGARITGGLPTLGWSELNAEPTVVKTNAAHYSESFYFWRNSIDCDELIQMEENQIGGAGQFVNTQIKALIEATSYELNDAFINNTHRNVPTRSRSANTKCFVGLRERTENSDYGILSSETVKTASCNLSDAGITATEANKFIRQMQSVLDAMGFPDGDDCIIYMNDDLVARVEFGIRALGAGGGFDMTKDAFDRSVLSYRNAKIRRIGRKAPASDGTQAYVISSTETADGAKDTTGTYTSLYVAHYGMDSLHAWQFFAPRVKPKMTLDNTVIERVTWEGGYGLNNPNTRAIGRLKGIQVS